LTKNYIADTEGTEPAVARRKAIGAGELRIGQEITGGIVILSAAKDLR
jgi:hypothetical protein